jgi:hypothetical protein
MNFVPNLEAFKSAFYKQLQTLKQPVLVGLGATTTAVALPFVANYFGCNVGSEWITVGTSGAIGSVAAAHVYQNGIPKLK